MSCMLSSYITDITKTSYMLSSCITDNVNNSTNMSCMLSSCISNDPRCLPLHPLDHMKNVLGCCTQNGHFTLKDRSDSFCVHSPECPSVCSWSVSSSVLAALLLSLSNLLCLGQLLDKDHTQVHASVFSRKYPLNLEPLSVQHFSTKKAQEYKEELRPVYVTE